MLTSGRPWGRGEMSGMRDDGAVNLLNGRCGALLADVTSRRGVFSGLDRDGITESWNVRTTSRMSTGKIG